MANIWKNSLQSTRYSLAIIYKNTEVGMPDFFCDTQSQFRNLTQALLQLQFRNLKKCCSSTAMTQSQFFSSVRFSP
jgi:hypothetical protein